MVFNRLIAAGLASRPVIASKASSEANSGASRETGSLPFSAASCSRFSVGASVLLSLSASSDIRPPRAPELRATRSVRFQPVREPCRRCSGAPPRPPLIDLAAGFQLALDHAAGARGERGEDDFAEFVAQAAQRFDQLVGRHLVEDDAARRGAERDDVLEREQASANGFGQFGPRFGDGRSMSSISTRSILLSMSAKRMTDRPRPSRASAREGLPGCRFRECEGRATRSA